MLALLLKYAVIVNNLKIKPNISLKKEKKTCRPGESKYVTACTVAGVSGTSCGK